MNILFLGYSMPQGITYHFVDWVNSLSDAIGNQNKLYLLTLKTDNNINLIDKINTFNNISTIYIKNNHELKELSVLDDIDIVHCHGIDQLRNLLLIKNKRKLSCRIIITMHSFKNYKWYNTLYRNLISLLYLDKSDYIHYLTNKSYNELTKNNLFYPYNKQSFVFPLGCNPQEFQSPFKQEYNENNSEFNVVYLANFTFNNKQHLWLINALKDIIRKYHIVLWLIGGGPLVDKVKAEVHKHNITKYVRFTGAVDREHVPEFLSKMDLAVCVSKSETFGHCIIEPMFAGLPIITTDVGIAPSIIADFSNGFIFCRKEKHKFNKAIEYLIHNKSKLIEMGRNAQLFVTQYLTWDITASKTLAMYDYILQNEQY